MKTSRLILLAFPVIFSVLALSGCGFFYQSAASFSCCIILFLFADKKANPTIWFIIAAFLLSIGGDWFLSHRNGQSIRFIFGIGLFLMAHIGYIIFCVRNGRIKYSFLLFILIGYLLLFYYVLYPTIQDKGLLLAVLFYLVTSCLSLAAAAGIKLAPITCRLFTAGIAMLVFSDTLIALHEFAGYNTLYGLMLPTYYGSQIMITLSLPEVSQVKSKVPWPSPSN